MSKLVGLGEIERKAGVATRKALQEIESQVSVVAGQMSAIRRNNAPSLTEASSITVRIGNGDDVGPRPRVSLHAGSLITISAAEDETNNEIDVTIGTTGISGTYLPLAGGTMTGKTVISASGLSAVANPMPPASEMMLFDQDPTGASSRSSSDSVRFRCTGNNGAALHGDIRIFMDPGQNNDLSLAALEFQSSANTTDGMNGAWVSRFKIYRGGGAVLTGNPGATDPALTIEAPSSGGGSGLVVKDETGVNAFAINYQGDATFGLNVQPRAITHYGTLFQDGDSDFQTNVSIGDTLTLGLAFDGNGIILENILDPTNPQDAATKAYVDAAGGAYLPLAGGTVTGDVYLEVDGNAALEIRQGGGTPVFTVNTNTQKAVVSNSLDVNPGGAGGATFLFSDADRNPLLSMDGDGKAVGFFNVVAAPQGSDYGALTDSTGGTPASSLVDVGVIFSRANINNNFASLNAKLDAIRAQLQLHGLMA